jgi:hypothetical protein
MWPGRAAWWILPLWSMLGGMWAFSRTALDESPTYVALALALVAGGWQPLWHVAAHTDWADPLSKWRTWTRTAEMPAWPYLESGTPGAALHQSVAQARSWWYKVGRDHLTQPIKRGLLALLISLLLGTALGRDTLLLTLGFTALSQLAALWHEGKGQVGAVWSAITLVGLPWLLGASLHGEGVQGALTAAVLIFVAGLFAQNAWWSFLGPVVGAAFLVSYGQPLAAGWLLLIALPGLIVLTQRPTDERYAPVSGFSILAMITLIAAVV